MVLNHSMLQTKGTLLLQLDTRHWNGIESQYAINKGYMSMGSTCPERLSTHVRKIFFQSMLQLPPHLVLQPPPYFVLQLPPYFVHQLPPYFVLQLPPYFVIQLPPYFVLTLTLFLLWAQATLTLSAWAHKRHKSLLVLPLFVLVFTFFYFISVDSTHPERLSTRASYSSSVTARAPTIICANFHILLLFIIYMSVGSACPERLSTRSSNRFPPIPEK